jgi:triosephosphate isomerase (TIM)
MNPVTRRPLVAGNWKMHGNRQDAARLVGELLARGIGGGGADIVVCPPFVHLAEVGRQLEGGRIAIGAQNACAEEAGAHTGEISAAMLADLGCRYVIVGHSERRAMYGDVDALVARKFAAVRGHAMIPILCVGETLAERERNLTAEVVLRQLDAVLDASGVASFATAVIAYEPVWAIGTGRTATPEQAQEVHALIRDRIAKKDDTIAASLRVLYGGSVKADNAARLFAMPDVDGGLVGGASLKSAEFAGICTAADG